MKNKDIMALTLWIFVPLVIILSSCLSGCSPLEVKIIEEIADEAIESDIKSRQQ